MDQIINYIAGQLGVDPATLLLILGFIVALSNLLGRFIPDDATGPLGYVRKVAKVLGLYLSNRVVGQITVNDATRAVAGATSITSKDPATGQFQATKLGSPAIVGILAIIFALLLAGCTATQKARADSTVAAICTSAPLAQVLYNTAVASGDSSQVNRVLDTLQASCPSVLILIRTIPVKAEPAPTANVGERG